MKKAIIRLIDSFAKDSDLRSGVVVGSLILAGFLILVLSVKSCIGYEACSRACISLNNETTIKCLEHCDNR